jgi:hypothetical protein
VSCFGNNLKMPILGDEPCMGLPRFGYCLGNKYYILGTRNTNFTQNSFKINIDPFPGTKDSYIFFIGVSRVAAFS